MTETLTPLSESDNLHAFAGLLSYPRTPGGRRQRDLDHELLGLLQEQLRLSPFGGVDGNRPKVRDLGPNKINAAVAIVENRHYGEWCGPEPTGEILTALDNHFRPLQQAHAERQAATNERVRAQVEGSIRYQAELDAQQRAQYLAVWGIVEPEATAA